MPYLFQTGLQPHLNGTPVMRSMFVEFPDDPTCRTLDRQYMFGPNLLVAPVFTYSGDVGVLPACWRVDQLVHRREGGFPSMVWRNDGMADTIPLWCARQRAGYQAGPGSGLRIWQGCAVPCSSMAPMLPRPW